MDMQVTKTNHDNAEEFIYGIKGLCELLNVSKGTALRMKKIIPHYQLPGARTVRFKKSEVLEALSKNK